MKRALLAILLLLTLLPLEGRRLPRYPFIRTDKNVLQGESPDFQLVASWTRCYSPVVAMSVSST